MTTPSQAASVLVTGGAGFIGSHVVDRLVAGGARVRVVDNLSNSTPVWIQPHLDSGRVTLHQLDILDIDALAAAMAGADRVIHLAASVDMRVGLADNWVDVEQSIVGTRSVLEAMRRSGTNRIAFSSSSTIYGESVPRPTAEDAGPLLPISIYGAGKLGAEALLSAYNHLYGIEAAIFRFGNVVGGRMNHGVIYDFIQKLRADPVRLSVLGDGKQHKNYFLVEDCARGLIELPERAAGGVLVVNLGAPDTVSVTEIAAIVAAELRVQPELIYSGGERGWPGDVPTVEFVLTRAHELGWRASRSSTDAVREAARRLCEELCRDA